MGCRQFLQRRVKELEAAKKAFIVGERAKREAERAKREADLKNSNVEFKASPAGGVEGRFLQLPCSKWPSCRAAAMQLPCS